MGFYQNNAAKSGGATKKRGSVRNDDRLEAFARGSKKGSADWGGCDPDWVLAVILAITSMGGAVTFGLSRDKGAHSMTLLLDGERATMWFNGDADLNEELEAAVGTLKAMD